LRDALSRGIEIELRTSASNLSQNNIMALHTKPLIEHVALITGGGTGIGREFAAALVEAGARAIVIASRRVDVLRQTADELNKQFDAERVFPFEFDIRDLAQTEALVRETAEQFGAIDLLVNNSGLA